MIAESDAAIIGVQEFLPKMRQDLKTLLDGYSIFGKGRLSGKDPGNDEHSDIIIKNNDVEVASCTTFWLSKHPDVPSRAYFAGLSKNLHRCRGEDQKEWKDACGYSTPILTMLSPFARTFGAKMILEQIHRFNQTDPLPTIVMGDFNAKPNSKAVSNNERKSAWISECKTSGYLWFS